MENQNIEKVKKVNGKEYKIKPDEYYKNFQKAHPEKKESQTCTICFGEYNYYSQYRHKKSIRHKKAVEQQNKINAPPPSPQLSECAISTDTEISSDFK